MEKNTEKINHIYNIADWKKRRNISSVLIKNFNDRQFNIIKEFIKQHNNFYICKTENENHIILCKQEKILMLKP